MTWPWIGPPKRVFIITGRHLAFDHLLCGLGEHVLQRLSDVFRNVRVTIEHVKGQLAGCEQIGCGSDQTGIGGALPSQRTMRGEIRYYLAIGGRNSVAKGLYRSPGS